MIGNETSTREETHRLGFPTVPSTQWVFERDPSGNEHATDTIHLRTTFLLQSTCLLVSWGVQDTPPQKKVNVKSEWQKI